MNNMMKSSFGFRALFLSVWMLVTTAFADGEAILSAAQNLDSEAKNVDTQSIFGDLATIFKVDQALVEKFLGSKGYQWSELVYVKLLADKTSQTPEAVIKANADRDWLVALKKTGVAEKDAVQQLNTVYTELAFLLLDKPSARLNTKTVVARKR